MARRFSIFQEDSWRVDMRGWPFVIVVGLFLAALAIIDDGALHGVGAGAAGAAGVTATTGPCSFHVNATDVNVRDEASATASSEQKLTLGDTVAATGFLSNGFRRLTDGRWVLSAYLTPVVGNTCA